MQAESRRRERRQQIIDTVVEQLGFTVSRVLDLTKNEAAGRFLEGTGSLVLDRCNRVAYACISPRTHPALASDLDVLAELSNSELLEYLRKAVLALPEQYREAVALCDLEEMSYADAAALLECSPGTVASRLHRARTMLKMKLSCQKCVK